MKQILLSAFLGVISLAATAQTEPDSAVRIQGYQIELPAKAFRMYPGDFDVYKGSYDLSNGETMVLRSRGRRMFADIGDRPRTEMVAASPNEFVAVDRQFRMTLTHEWYGPVTGELLLVVPKALAQSTLPGMDVVRLSAGR